jgi:RNA polymerase sigma-70 factor (ECF subfamily)
VLKHLEREKMYADPDADMEVAYDTPGALADMTRSETIDAVRQAVLSLPAGYREAVVMCDLEEMSYADTAAVLKVPVGTVRSRLNRGRALLMDKLRIARSFA